MTFRDEVLEFLGAAGLQPANPDDIAGRLVRRFTMPVRLWTGNQPRSGPVDCRKGAALLRARGGARSCIEVEVVRLARRRWKAGWVQGYPCGAESWSRWQWPRTVAPDAVRATNDAVQTQLGKGQTFGGHPDVAVTDGRRVAYLECKMLDSLKPSQIAWFDAAFRAGILAPDDVAIVEGLPR